MPLDKGHNVRLALADGSSHGYPAMGGRDGMWYIGISLHITNYSDNDVHQGVLDVCFVLFAMTSFVTE